MEKKSTIFGTFDDIMVLKIECHSWKGKEALLG
jgi:hypothetical protein